jgi:hypothetical protein
MKIARVPLWRFLAGMAAIGAACTALLAAGRLAGPACGALAAVAFTVVLSSLGEWLVHGVLYHGRIPGLGFIRSIHHRGHHFALFPPTRYVQHGPHEFMRIRDPLPYRMSDNILDNLLSKWSQVALHFVAGIPLVLAPAWLLTRSPAFLCSSLATLTIISWLLAHVHGAIHTPRDRWIEHRRWFQWLDRHHYIHHIDLAANINFMLPLCDLLFGTQKWTLDEREAAAWPSFEEAKPMAKDVSVEAPAA